MSPSLLICVWACVTFDLTYLPLPTQTNSHIKQLEEELRGLDQSVKSLHASDEKVCMLVAINILCLYVGCYVATYVFVGDVGCSDNWETVACLLDLDFEYLSESEQVN